MGSNLLLPSSVSQLKAFLSDSSPFSVHSFLPFLSGKCVLASAPPLCSVLSLPALIRMAWLT